MTQNGLNNLKKKKIHYIGPLKTSELLRSYLVLRSCGMPLLNQNVDFLWKTASTVLGTRLASKVVEKTFFAHFCGGVDMESLGGPLARLKELGIRPILDYAAEDDPDKAVEERPIAKQGVLDRVYDYGGEQVCDKNMVLILSALEASASSSSEPDGVVAIKVTALCRPALLIKASSNLNAVRRLWNEHFELASSAGAHERAGVTPEAFKAGMDRALGPEGSRTDPAMVFAKLDLDKQGSVDFIEWTQKFDLESFVTREKWQRVGLDVEHVFGGKVPFLDARDTPLLDNLRRRVEMIADRAAALGVRLLIDAEHTYIQPAIDQICRELQAKYNNLERPFPIVYNTYQCYLKSARQNVLDDLVRSRRAGQWFAGKVVRGAYMIRERERARENKTEDPILPTIQDTHDSYNWCVEQIIKNHKQSQVIIASHNQESIERATALMEQHNIPRGSQSVMFAQLLGMADNLSLTLGREGYRIYKYVPYGPVAEVIPYLSRRAQENSDMLSNVGKELVLLREALRVRGIRV